jgi:hypothetical protein
MILTKRGLKEYYFDKESLQDLKGFGPLNRLGSDIQAIKTIPETNKLPIFATYFLPKVIPEFSFGQN